MEFTVDFVERKIRSLQKAGEVSSRFADYMRELFCIIEINENIGAIAQEGKAGTARDCLIHSKESYDQIFDMHIHPGYAYFYGTIGADQSENYSGHEALVNYAVEIHTDSIQKMLEGFFQKVVADS